MTNGSRCGKRGRMNDLENKTPEELAEVARSVVHLSESQRWQAAKAIWLLMRKHQVPVSLVQKMIGDGDVSRSLIFNYFHAYDILVSEGIPVEEVVDIPIYKVALVSRIRPAGGLRAWMDKVRAYPYNELRALLVGEGKVHKEVYNRIPASIAARWVAATNRLEEAFQEHNITPFQAIEYGAELVESLPLGFLRLHWRITIGEAGPDELELWDKLMGVLGGATSALYSDSD